MEIVIREEKLPGIGRRWELSAANGHSLVLVRTNTGAHQLYIRSSNKDEPDCAVLLTASEAIALAWLLAGVRIVAEPGEDSSEAR